MQAAWDLVEAMNSAHKDADCKILQEVPFIGISMDESTTVDNVQYLSIEATYWIPTAGKRSMFIELCEVPSANAATICSTLVQCLGSFGLSDEQIAHKLIGLAADGASVFQGQHNGVFTR